MSSKNFIIKNGLTVGTTEVIDSSGNVTASGVGAAVQEAIADKIGGILSATGGATATYNDGADTIVIDVPITDEDDMSSNSATAIPSQQSVKAYVDSQILTKDNTDEITEGSTNLYFTNARADARITNALIDEDNMSSNSATKLPSQQSVKAYVDSQVASKDALSELSGDTDDITEGSTNLYHTTARVNSAFDTRLATKNTANLTEGSNLYHTTERVQDVVGGQLATNGSHTGIAFSYDDANDGAIDATVSLGSFDTDDLSEGSGNLYFTNARADARVSASLPNTDSLGEGSSNLYFTNERVDDRVNALLTAGTGITLSYDDSGNALTISGSAQYGDSDAREAISVTDAGGDGSLAYNNSTGVLTYTGPSASEVRAHISGGTGVTVSSGEISIGQAVATTSNVQFGNLTLSGNLTVNGSTVTNSATNTTIEDALIELGSGNSGANSNDLGLILERGSTGDNAFMGWDESEDRFVVATTTATGASTGALTLTDANFRASQISTSYASNSGGVARNIYQSTSAPGSSDGAVGDLWILYS